MKLLNLYSIQGPNIFSYHPVVVMEIDLAEYSTRYTNEITGFTQSLVELFPGLKEHHCSKGYPGGFIERLEKGTLLGHVIEHLALELQTIVSKPVYYGKTRFIDECKGYRIIFSYYNEQLGLEAGKKAFKCIDDLMSGKRVEPSRIIADLKKINLASEYGPSTKALIEEASKRGIPMLPLSSESSLIQLGYGIKQKRIQATITAQTSCISVDLACDKMEAKKILTQMGIPVPKGYLVTSLTDAIRAMEKLGTPVVLKPVDGNQGKGVALNIDSLFALKKAFEVGKKFAEKILIEEFIKGNDYRLTVVNGKMVAASHRLPPFVIGDGIHNIFELVQMINSDSLRGDGHEKPLTKIKIDHVVLMNLAKLNLKLDTVLPMGERIFLRDNGNLSTGGTAYDVTDLVHPENKQLIERAARVIDLDVAGVDVRIEDISRPISRYGGVIIEVNAAPGIRMHHFPTAGKKRNVAKKIIEMLFPEGNGRIPIFSVTGTNGKTTTVRLIQHILQNEYHNVGMTTTDGIYINQSLIYPGDTTGPWSAQVILKDPTVEIAVLETARGGIIKSGLGYDRSDVGIFLNLSEDHLGTLGIENLDDLLHAKSLVIETVKRGGICVLNGDDPHIVKAARLTQGQIIYFCKSLNNPVIQKHLQSGGKAVVLNNSMIETHYNNQVTSVISINDIPLTWNGKACHQIENVLAVVAGLTAFGLNLQTICAGLRSFKSDLQCNPGRLNLIEGNGWKVLIDYGHNHAGYKYITEFVEKIEHSRLLGVVGVPGDREDRSIYRVGELIGKKFDLVWIKEDIDLRGRNRGDVAEILKQGIFKVDQSIIRKVVYDEKEALKNMLTELKAGDLGVIFYEKEPEEIYKIVIDYIEKIDREEKNRPLVINSSR